MKPGKALLATVVVPLLIAAQACAGNDSCRYSAEREADIDSNGASRVEVFAFAGDLKVLPAQGSAVTARGRACAATQADLQQTLLQAKRDGDVIRVFVEVPDRADDSGSGNTSMDLEVRIPADLPVTVTDTSGQATIEGVRVTEVTDTSGDLLIRDIQSSVEIRDSSGDLRVENAAAGVTITDSSGGIEILGAGEVLIRSDSSGDIAIERVTGNVLIENDSSGDIAISDVGRNFELLADSSGRVLVSDVGGNVSLPPYKHSQ